MILITRSCRLLNNKIQTRLGFFKEASHCLLCPSSQKQFSPAFFVPPPAWVVVKVHIFVRSYSELFSAHQKMKNILTEEEKISSILAKTDFQFRAISNCWQSVQKIFPVHVWFCSVIHSYIVNVTWIMPSWCFPYAGVVLFLNIPEVPFSIVFMMMLFFIPPSFPWWFFFHHENFHTC